jgi:hypothetical protein
VLSAAAAESEASDTRGGKRTGEEGEGKAKENESCSVSTLDKRTSGDDETNAKERGGTKTRDGRRFRKETQDNETRDGNEQREEPDADEKRDPRGEPERTKT